MISMHGNHLVWNEDRKKSCMEFGSTVFIFSAFNLFVLWNINATHKVLLPTHVSSHCSELADFYLLQNLLSLLMRLIKPVQSLFNEAPAAQSTERATAGKTDQSRLWGAKLLNGFLKRGFKKLNQSKVVINHWTTEQWGPLRDEGSSPVTFLSVI